MDAGTLEIIGLQAPHEAQRALGPQSDYDRWMTKHNLDVALLMEACATRGTYYLHLEDDVLASPDWRPRLAAWMSRYFPAHGDWAMLCLYHSHHWPDRQEYALERFHGAMGLLFRCADLPPLVAYLRRRCAEAPNDWLIRDYLLETGGRAFVHTPSLFQHIGILSSRGDRVQLLDAPSYEESWWPRQRRQLSALGTLLRRTPRRALAMVWQRIRMVIGY